MCFNCVWMKDACAETLIIFILQSESHYSLTTFRAATAAAASVDMSRSHYICVVRALTLSQK